MRTLSTNARDAGRVRETLGVVRARRRLAVGASHGDGGGYVRKRRWRWVRVDGVDAGGGDEIVREAGVAMRRETVRRKKFVALELVREQIGGNPCDRRRSVSEYKSEFPGVDFSLVEEEHDVLWKPGRENREPEPELRARAGRFLHWCFEREEDSIIVVTHSAFMSNLMIEYCMGGHEPCEVMREHLHAWPRNCECRPLVVVDSRRTLTPHPFYHAGAIPRMSASRSETTLESGLLL